MLQFGQALASGALQGDELRSLLEQAPYLMQKLADSLGVPVGKLKELGAQGKLTADVIVNALSGAASAIEEDFADLPVTVGDALTQLDNSFMVLIGTMNEGSEVSGTLSEVITALAGVFDDLAKAVSIADDDADDLTKNDVKRWADDVALAFAATADIANVLIDGFASAALSFGQLIEVSRAGVRLAKGDLDGAKSAMKDADRLAERANKRARDAIFGRQGPTLFDRVQAVQATRDTNKNPFGPFDGAVGQIDLKGNLKARTGGGGGGVKRDSAAETLKDLEFEREQLKRSAMEQEVYILLKKAGVSATSAMGEKIASSARAFILEREAVERDKQQIEENARAYDQMMGERSRAIDQMTAETDRLRGSVENYGKSQSEILRNEADLIQAQIDKQMAIFGTADAYDVLRVAHLREQAGYQETLELLDRANQATDEHADKLNDLAGVYKGVFQGMEDALTDFATGQKTSWKDLVDSIESDILRLIVRASIIQPLQDKILGKSGTGADGALGSILGIFSGAGSSGATGAAAYGGSYGQYGLGGPTNSASGWASAATGILGLFSGFFDTGGSIPAGRWGIVGERGPEMVRGPASVTGRRETADAMSGGGKTFNINVNVPESAAKDRGTRTQFGTDVGNAISKSMARNN